VKLPGHRPGLPGKVISFHIVPLDPAYKAGLAVHVPAKSMPKFRIRSRESKVEAKAKVEKELNLSLNLTLHEVRKPQPQP